eukprot:CAMPEP_0116034728 /NCGR_PEP_ID=MMETSP0321-20121206/19825_1 /TAXON_ID=163516 /ORGANISM="Leptocylindrus danicus var. danicus, Strain B650" /LENGTH=333 /DNA_ID=CAMNT_0003511185 /DNA_START=103 /DNA_END=1104 /DNA_ORIENTATION=-
MNAASGNNLKRQMIASNHHQDHYSEDCNGENVKKLKVEDNNQEAPIKQIVASKPSINLPNHVLAKLLVFSDVQDILSISLVCKEWYQALGLAERPLWNSLVKKYHPIIEQITDMVRSDPAVTGDTPRVQIQPNWKKLFERRVVNLKQNRQSNEFSRAPSNVNQSLATFLFHVDLQKIKEENEIETDGERGKDKVACSLICNASYKDLRRGCLILDPIEHHPDARYYCDGTHCATIYVINRHTGKQAVVCRHSYCRSGEVGNPLVHARRPYDTGFVPYMSLEGCYEQRQQQTTFTLSFSWFMTLNESLGERLGVATPMTNSDVVRLLENGLIYS